MNNQQLIESLSYYINEVSTRRWVEAALISLPQRELAVLFALASGQDQGHKDYQTISLLNRRLNRARRIADINVGSNSRSANQVKQASVNSRRNIISQVLTNEEVREIVDYIDKEIKRNPLLADFIVRLNQKYHLDNLF